METKKVILLYSRGSKPIQDAATIYLAESLDDVMSQPAKQIVIDKKMIQNDVNFKGEIVLGINEEGKIKYVEIIGDAIPDNLKD
jgi:hypothetical protein